MDEVTRAVELTKAKILELNGAFLQVICRASDAPRTYEDLRARVERTGREWTQDCNAIREQVAKEAAEKAVKGRDLLDLGDVYKKQIRDIKGLFNERLKVILGGLVNPEEAEAVASSMDEFYDVFTDPILQNMLKTTADFDLKIKEMTEKIEELKAEDDGEDWKRG